MKKLIFPVGVLHHSVKNKNAQERFAKEYSLQKDKIYQGMPKDNQAAILIP